MVREYKGAYWGEHGDGLCAPSGSRGSSARGLTRAFAEVKRSSTRTGLMNPGKIVRGTRMDDARLFRYPPGYRSIAARTALDWSAWNVQADPPTDTDRAGQRRRPGARLRQGRRDVQQQRPLPQVRRRHDVPELPRHARRTAPHARPRQHVAAGAVGPARPGFRQRSGARSAGPVRELQGLQARMPDRRRHGEDEDRVRLALAADARAVAEGSADRAPAALGAVGSALSVARQPARHAARRSAAVRAWSRALGAADAAALAQRHVLLELQRARQAVDGHADVVLFVDTFNDYLEPENAHAALRVLQAAGYAGRDRAAARRR